MSQQTARRIAWVFFGAVLAGAAAYAAMYYPDRLAGVEDQGIPASSMIQALAEAFFGFIVVRRFWHNPVGWLFLVGLGFPDAMNQVAQLYAVFAHNVTHDALPGWVIAVWLGSWLFIPGVLLLPTFVILLFPDGHLPSPGWRYFAWPLGLLLAIAIIAAAIGAVPTRPDFHFTPGGGIADTDRLGLEFFNLPVVAGALGCLFALAQRFRRSQGDEREQLKWFLAAVALVIVTLVLAFISAYNGGPTSGPSVWGLGLYSVATLTVPAAVAVAILKYRLYDIDVVVSRTLVYGALAAFITAVYVGIVVGVGTLVGSGGQPNLLLSIVATAIVAVAFQPLRERLQKLANRIVYGKRATPYEILSQFSQRVAETYASKETLPRMARVLAEGTGAERAQVWLRSGGALRLAAAWPEVPASSSNLDAANGSGTVMSQASLGVTGQLMPDIPDVNRAVAVRHQGELLGALAVKKRTAESLTPIEEKLLEDLAHQAGLVLKNVGLTAELLARLEDLRASRQRLVAAQDEERRRLERNLHDGAQQNLVALKVKLALAEMLAEKDPDKARTMLAELKGDTDETLETLRDLARGIYPPLLADKGLAAALEAQGRKATLPVKVDADGVGRYPQEAEAAAYFCVLEALQNVQKYAGATHARVQLSERDGVVIFQVEDDGKGFDPATAKRGAGMTNMADRLDALGGSIEFDSKPGAGATVRGSIPVPEEGGAQMTSQRPAVETTPRTTGTLVP
jgi:signal transduction histidine kinase